MSENSENVNSGYTLTALEENLFSEENEEMNHETSLNTTNNNQKQPATDHRNCKEKNNEREILDEIAKIRKEVEGIEQEIQSLSKHELRLKFQKYEEILIQKTIELDKIDTKCLEKIRERRKKTVIYIQQCLRTIDDTLNQ